MKKVVITGPESTGKSTLTALLAQHFSSLWVPEYAREYLRENGKDYDQSDLLKIAEGQLRLEDEMTERSVSNGNDFLFVDTDMYVMKVWSEFVFGKCDPFILQQIARRKYDLYLLCNIDLPWVEDELREHPEVETRRELFEIYKDLMVHQSTPWRVIEGDYSARLNLGIQAVNEIMQ